MSINHLLQVTEDHSMYNAGITSAVDALMRQVASKPIALRQSMLCTSVETISLPDGVALSCLPPSPMGHLWRYAPGSSQLLVQAISQADVVHLHGIWMWVQWAAARTAHRLGKPFVITVHGMLEPWIWERQHWPGQLKKSLYWRMLAYPAFRHASVVHAIHSTEAQTLKRYFKIDPSHPYLPEVKVIPHSLDLEAIDLAIKVIDRPENSGLDDFSTNPNSMPFEPYILFLGRLHPVKGIDLLIKAFSRLDDREIKLKIAGFSQTREAAYEAYLRQIVTQAGLDRRVEFLGGVQGLRKWELLRNAWVFCLPSHTEVIGMVNLEAAACYTPVITTNITGVGPEWVKNGGVLIEPDVLELEHALGQALLWTRQERMDRGHAMRQLIETTYSWRATLEQWTNVYERLGVMR